MLSEIGEMVFSIVIGYMGALEFLYVVRHLYHWSFQHPDENKNYENIKNLQERLQIGINEADNTENSSNAKVMQDGVLYKDGFRINPNQNDIDDLKNQIKHKEQTEKRKKEIEAELAIQKKIEEETRNQLKQAEEELALQRKEAEENARKIEEEKARKLLEAERAKKLEQRKREEEEENTKKMIEKEKENQLRQKQLEEQREAEENARRLREEELKREEQQRQIEEQREAEENARRLREEELKRDEQQRQIEEQREAEENARRLREEELKREEQQRQIEEQREAEKNSQKLLDAERNNELNQRNLEEQENNEQFQKLIEQEQKREMANILQFIQSEQDTDEERQIVDKEALHKLKTAKDEVELRQHISNDSNLIEVHEEPCIKKDANANQSNVEENADDRTNHSTVKTQYGQTSNSQYSKDIPTSMNTPSIHFDEYERQAPDGEDIPSQLYSDDYLRSLDGIKSKPLVREDGTGRRRAFKKRRSSGSSTSSRDSRVSREEELKMFTSLEEEEFESIRKGESEYSAIKYSSDPNLKVSKQHRRHRRSPAKDFTSDDGSVRGSLEMLDEESSNPWGEIKPEHYKNTEFWKREKTISIEEENDDKQIAEVQSIEARNIPLTSSFEEATNTQNQEAISSLQKTLSKENQESTNKNENEETENEKIGKNNKTRT